MNRQTQRYVGISTNNKAQKRHTDQGRTCLRRSTCYRLARAGLLISLFCNSNNVLATEPYIPTDDTEVLETLPSSVLSSSDELIRLRRELSQQPNNVALATIVANRYLQLGNLEGDLRYYGYAQAALRPWWEATSPPVEILKLRAELKEKDHGYNPALEDLKMVLEQSPRDVQAWIDLANIYRVQGKYQEASQACENLDKFADYVYSALCTTPIMAATGQAEESYDSLTQLLTLAGVRSPSAVQWILTTLAEIAVSLGRDELAEQHFSVGLDRDPNSLYMLRAYADFLLDHNRPEEVLPLLQPHIQDNGIILRATIAARQLGRNALADDWQQQLKSRFEEIRLRGSKPHGRYESRYWLVLENDPQQALQIALENWQEQKETRDTRNLLEAAIAANNVAAVQPVLQFLADNNTQDVILQKLVDQLESQP